ncbi:unnamed protein product [Rotaria sp. Silwood1]|nr:unnamed protein product [Rotaria sp. Silwood1]
MPTLTQYFSPDWVVEQNRCNNYSKLDCNQFNGLIENKENSLIDAITTSLKPITSEDIEYLEPKSIASLIIDFILTLKEKNLLPCIVFSDSRYLCERMATTVAKYFENLEAQLRETKYKNQIETLRKHVKIIEKIQNKVKSNKLSKSRKRNQDLEMLEEEINNQTTLSRHEQQLLYGILDESTLANRNGCDRQLVDAMLKRTSKENPRLVGYMRRGVAYHHAESNNKGRMAVEALFRNRYVQVVFSTATLGTYVNQQNV